MFSSTRCRNQSGSDRCESNTVFISQEYSVAFASAIDPKALYYGNTTPGSYSMRLADLFCVMLHGLYKKSMEESSVSSSLLASQYNPCGCGRRAYDAAVHRPQLCHQDLTARAQEGHAISRDQIMPSLRSPELGNTEDGSSFD